MLRVANVNGDQQIFFYAVRYTSDRPMDLNIGESRVFFGDFFRAKSATLCMFYLLFDESPMTEISPMNDKESACASADLLLV